MTAKYAPFPPMLFAFKSQVWDKVEEVDPNGQHDWYDIAFGFAMGYGKPVDEAHQFAKYAVDWCNAQDDKEDK
jgi:hypothetical protein